MVCSVLIANYNNSAYLEAALQSVINQSYNKWEIIIIDDCSSDNSVEVVNKFEGDRIKFFRNTKNQGCGFTKRRCVELATGDICGFLDADDTLAPDALKTMVEQHKQHNEIGLFYSTHYVCDEQLNPLYIPSWIGEFKEGESQLTNTRISHFATFKMEAYKRTEGIEPSFQRGVDQDLYLKLEEVTKTKFIDHPLYYYRKHDRGISTFGNNYKAKYWYLMAALNACDRRGLNKEEYFSYFLKREEQKNISFANTKEYKLGRLLLRPVHKIYSLFQ